LNNQIYWDITRASGFVALALLLLAVGLGLAIRRGWWDGALNRREVVDVHRFVASSTIVALAVHIVSLLGDRFVGFSLADLLVPFHGAYRTIGVTAGILAMYGLVVVFITGFMVARLGYARWYSLHRISYGVLALSVLHVLATGTEGWSFGSLALCAAAAAFVLISRDRAHQPQPVKNRSR
jgi:sulfoxide reductase heme-binding subunit YedZ